MTDLTGLSEGLAVSQMFTAVLPVTGKLGDLCERLKDLEARADGAPLLSISDAASSPVWEEQAASPVQPSPSQPGQPSGDEWEML